MRTLPLGPSVEHGATNLLRGVPKWGGGGDMWTMPRGPSVELLMGHETRDACAEMVRGDACGPSQGIRRPPLMAPRSV